MVICRRVLLLIDERLKPAPKKKSLGAVSTFVIADIVAVRNALLAQGIGVGPIVGVLLCFFKDQEGNSLGLRQNSKGQPKTAKSTINNLSCRYACIRQLRV